MLNHSQKCNQISAICSSTDKKWIVTADKGPNCLLIIWEIINKSKGQEEKLFEAIPIKTFFQPHADTGVVSVCFSHDSKYLYTLGNGKKNFFKKNLIFSNLIL